MRVYNRTEFMKLPAGTLYCKGQKWYFEETCVKGDTFGNDWSELHLNWIDAGDEFIALDHMLHSGASYPLNDSYGRDGCFDNEDIFLVYERDDLLKLKDFIEQAIEVAK